jgi:hypothetical protein
VSKNPPPPVVAYATPSETLPGPEDAYYLKVVATCNDVCAGLVLFGGTVATVALAGRGSDLWGPAWMIAYGAVMVAPGIALRRRRARWLPIAVSGVNCAAFPIGTMLGIATIAVLMRPGVVSLFPRKPDPHP